jgi:hypothetical protein
MAQKKIQIDLVAKDKATKSIKKFSQTAEASFNKTKRAAKGLSAGMKSDWGKASKAVDNSTKRIGVFRSSMSKLSGGIRNSISKMTTGMRSYTSSIDKANASMRKLSVTSKTVKTAGAVSAAGMAGAAGVGTGAMAAGAAVAGIGLAGPTEELAAAKEKLTKANKAATKAGENYHKVVKRSKGDMAANIAAMQTSIKKHKAYQMAAKKTATLQKKANAAMNKAKAAGGGLGGSLSKLRAGWLAVGAAIYVAIRAIKAAIGAYGEQIDAETRLAGVLKATGYAAGLTIEELKKYAAQMQKQTTYGDELILNTMAVIATFKNIKKTDNVFADTTEAVLDMATVMGTDARSAALQLGKALNDPITGVSALTRVGVTFTEQQKKQIKTLAEQGKLLEAQKIILTEIKSEFGGVSREMAKTPIGKIKQMANAWSDFKEKVGLLTALLIEKLAPVISELISGLGAMTTELTRFFGLADKKADAPIRKMIEYDNQLTEVRDKLSDINRKLEERIAIDEGDEARLDKLRAEKKVLEDQYKNLTKLRAEQKKLVDEQAGGLKPTPFVTPETDEEDPDLKLIKQLEELFIRRKELMGENLKAELDAEHYRYKYYVETNGKIKGAAEVHLLELQSIRKKYAAEEVQILADKLKAQDELEKSAIEKRKETLEAIAAIAKSLEDEEKARLDELAAKKQAAQEKLEDLIDTYAASPISDMFTDWVTGAKDFQEAFSDMAMSIGRDLIRMATQALILKAVTAGIGAFSGGGTTPTTIRGGQGGGYGFKNGGITRSAAGGAEFNGPKTGYPALLHGNEAVIPLQNGAVPVNMKGSQGGVTNNITMNVQAAEGMSNEEAANQGRNMMRGVHAEIDKRLLYQMHPGGLLYAGGR